MACATAVGALPCAARVQRPRRRRGAWRQARRAPAVSASDGGGGDGVGAATVALVRSKLEAVLSPVTRLDVVDVSGDGRHVTIDAVADVFEGKSKLQRQRLVFGALWEEMKDGGPLHAVDHMQTKTPSEAGL